MSSFRRMLSRRLDRLSATLSALRERLHEALAASLGQAVADAVREAVETLLTNAAASDFAYRPYDQQLWDTQADDPWSSEAGSWNAGGLERVSATPELISRPREHARRALCAGLQAAAWWVRRTRGGFVSTLTLGIGLATAWIVYAGGTLAAACAGLIGSALAVGALGGLARSGASLAHPV